MVEESLKEIVYPAFITEKNKMVTIKIIVVYHSYNPAFSLAIISRSYIPR